jgi:hypothetical protein
MIEVKKIANQRWTGRVRYEVTRKKGAGLQFPEGLDNRFLF